MRGLLLNALLKRQAHRKYGIITSVLVLSVLFAGCHDSFWGGLVGQVTLSAVFLVFRRSLAASMIAHSTLNLVVSFPSLLLLRALYVSRP
jgi:membrane protease YdiL (CAAX protease family)